MANENLKNGPVNPDAENDEEMTVTLTLDDGTEDVYKRQVRGELCRTAG